MKKVAFSFNKTRKFGLIGAAIFVFTLIFMMSAYPPIIRSYVKKKVGLKEGRRIRESLWRKPLFPSHQIIHVYNITNPDDVDNGAKPILKTVGPYYYEMWELKTNITDHEEDDTVSFSRTHSFFLEVEKTHPLTGEEEVIIPNVFVLGLAHYIMRKTPAMSALLDKAVDSVWNKPKSLFMRVKVRTLLFDGMVISCKANDFGGSIVCSAIRRDWQKMNIFKLSEDDYYYTLFYKNYTIPLNPVVRINRGLRNVMDVGRVVAIDGKNNRSVWNNTYCDAFRGSDSMYHPFFDKSGKEDLILYTQFCRSLNYKFVDKTKHEGLSVLKYESYLDIDPENNPLDRCYCTDPDKCFKKGAMDLFKCLREQTTFVLTNPHFYYGDKDYIDAVVGLNPNQESHASYMLLEPFTGSVVLSHLRLQLNMPLMQVKKFKLMKNFQDKTIMIPLLWCDEIYARPSTSIDDIKFILEVYKAGYGVQIALILIGSFMMGFSVFKIYKNKKAEKNIEAPKKKVAIQPAFSIS